MGIFSKIKIKQIFKVSIFLVFVSLVACEDEIRLEIDSEKPEIVIYGEINNGIGPYRVRVQKPSNYGSQTVRDFNQEAIEKAKVSISDDAGNEEVLMEEFPGIYVTSKKGIRGVVGRKYTLKVEALGKIFQSKSELLPETPQVETVYNEFNNAKKPLDFGHNVYIKIKDKPLIENNYMIRSASFNEFKIDQSECFVNDCPEIVLRCWKYQHGSVIGLVNDKLIDGQTFRQYIDFAPMDEVVDYAMYISVSNGSRGLYQYWQRLETQSKLTGSIFDVQSAQVQGNIRGTNGEEALGYFGVVGIKQIRYKFNRFDATPSTKATELIAYNLDFRPRIKEKNCRNIYYFKSDTKIILGFPYPYPNNVGNQLPAWWHELDEVN